MMQKLTTIYVYYYYLTQDQDFVPRSVEKPSINWDDLLIDKEFGQKHNEIQSLDLESLDTKEILENFLIKFSQQLIYLNEPIPGDERKINEHQQPLEEFQTDQFVVGKNIAQSDQRQNTPLIIINNQTITQIKSKSSAKVNQDQTIALLPLQSILSIFLEIIKISMRNNPLKPNVTQSELQPNRNIEGQQEVVKKRKRRPKQKELKDLQKDEIKQRQKHFLNYSIQINNSNNQRLLNIDPRTKIMTIREQELLSQGEKYRWTRIILRQLSKKQLSYKNIRYLWFIMDNNGSDIPRCVYYSVALVNSLGLENKYDLRKPKAGAKYEFGLTPEQNALLQEPDDKRYHIKYFHRDFARYIYETRFKPYIEERKQPNYRVYSSDDDDYEELRKSWFQNILSLFLSEFEKSDYFNIAQLNNYLKNMEFRQVVTEFLEDKGKWGYDEVFRNRFPDMLVVKQYFIDLVHQAAQRLQ